MIPIKPFKNYKWRWLSVAPTENLLDPPVFLGVLRVYAKYDNKASSDPAIASDLAIVQNQTGTTVDLVRTPERNLIRNSGQYWKGTGLLTTLKGKIHLTVFGRQVAEGHITQSEFASIIVQQTIFPNELNYNKEEIEEWHKAKLEIKPFVLILEVLEKLNFFSTLLHGSAYITPQELIKIIIPLAGNKYNADEIATFINEYRNKNIDIQEWTDCVPLANDRRIAREFLLFLANFGICRRIDGISIMEEKYYLDEIFEVKSVTAYNQKSILSNETNIDDVVEAIRDSSLPSIIERQKTFRKALTRPGQSRFREKILKAYSRCCIITQENISEILEAAHIIPVNYGGVDEEANGLCLRVDIHRLFDSGKIRIKSTGDLVLSDSVRSSGNYTFLPSKITIPPFVNTINIDWREKYC